jgi:methylase of polypeptide subunit release factors
LVFSPVIYDEFASIPFLGEGEVVGRSFLEVGCGVGYAAIRAKRMGATKVEATDISKPAVECAKKNVKFAKLEKEIKVYQSDILQSVQGMFDIIFWNIPWSTSAHEESEQDQDLSGGIKGGTGLVERFLTEGKEHLTALGSLYLVICLQEGIGKECVNHEEFLALVEEHQYEAPVELEREPLKQQEEDSRYPISVYLLRLDRK